MRILFLTLCFLTLNSLFAGEILLSGKAPGAEGKVLRVYRYDDLVSLRQVKLGSTYISDSGDFTLNIQVDQTILVQIFIDHHQTEMLVEPDHQYIMTIEGFERPGYREEVNPWLTPPYLYIILRNDQINNVTHWYDSLNVLSDLYVVQHSEALMSRRPSKDPDTLISLWQNQLNCSGVFMETAITYRAAQLSIGSSRKQRLKTFQRFIGDKPLWQNHTEYMTFFSQYFDKYISTSRDIPFYDLTKTINSTPDYAALSDLLGRDSLLRKAVVRELVLLVNMRDLLYHPEISSAGALEILQQMAANTSVPDHRRIALNLIHEFQSLRSGSQAPAIVLKSYRNDSVSLNNFLGKYVYIQFFTSWCTSCAADMQLMEKLQKEFGGDIHFLSISADIEPARYQAFMNRYSFPWSFAHFGGDFDLLRSYKVRAYPLYILVDREGKILSAPARSPAEEAAVYFNRLLNPLKKR